MTEFISSSSFFCVALTLVAYALASALQRRWRLAILNPLVIASASIIILLKLLGVPNAVYQAGCEILSFLLTPATICLAISFFEQFRSLRHHLGAIALGVLGGTVCCLSSVWLMCRFLDFDRVLMVSLLPKSITAAIGNALSEELGGLASITAAAIAITGNFGNIAGEWICRIFRIRDPIAQGVAFGTGSHVIGTARAAELNPMAGAVSSLALTIAGLFTVVILSFLVQFL